MSVQAERDTDQEREVLRSQGKEIIDGFREALGGNQEFIAALAESYWINPDLGYSKILFPTGNNLYRFGYKKSSTMEEMSVLRYGPGDEWPTETLEVDCGITGPSIRHSSKKDDESWGCLSEQEAIGLAQKLLDGLKPMSYLMFTDKP